MAQNKSRKKQIQIHRLLLHKMIAYIGVLAILFCAVNLARAAVQGKRAETEKLISSRNGVIGEIEIETESATRIPEATQALSAVQDAIAAGEFNLQTSAEKIEYIERHSEEYPEELIELLSRNVEAVDFIYSYPNLVSNGLNTREYGLDIRLSDKEIKQEYPLLLQWDPRWGAIPYGSSNIALSGCGPTCIAMVAAALIGDDSATPAAVADYAESQGYYRTGIGTDWKLITEGCEKYGLKANVISLSEHVMAKHIQNNEMIICSVTKGDFTQSGHFIVIYGYKNGRFLVNDPNSIARSDETWSFDRLAGQIRNLWALAPAD